MNRKKIIPALLGPLLFALTMIFFHPPGLSDQANAVLACTLWVAVWWIFEVTDISVTALLPIIIFPLTGALDLKSTAASYGHKYIFLYMGGFILAIAIEKWNLHKRIALNIIHVIGAGISKAETRSKSSSSSSRIVTKPVWRAGRSSERRTEGSRALGSG